MCVTLTPRKPERDFAIIHCKFVALFDLFTAYVWYLECCRKQNSYILKGEYLHTESEICAETVQYCL